VCVDTTSTTSIYHYSSGEEVAANDLVFTVDRDTTYRVVDSAYRVVGMKEGMVLVTNSEIGCVKAFKASELFLLTREQPSINTGVELKPQLYRCGTQVLLGDHVSRRVVGGKPVSGYVVKFSMCGLVFSCLGAVRTIVNAEELTFIARPEAPKPDADKLTPQSKWFMYGDDECSLKGDIVRFIDGDVDIELTVRGRDKIMAEVHQPHRGVFLTRLNKLMLVRRG